MQVAPSHSPDLVRYRQLLPGDPLPELTQACDELDSFNFKAFAGRYQLYAFFLSADSAEVTAEIDQLAQRRDIFDDQRWSFIGVSVRTADRQLPNLRPVLPGVHFARDYDYRMSQTCGAIPLGAAPGGATPARRLWVLVDPSMHVMQVIPMEEIGPDELLERLSQTSADPNRYGGLVRPAPILILPNVFEPVLCDELLERYRQGGGQRSGIHRADEGVYDDAFKVRRDCTLTDPELISRLNQRLARRVIPEIEKLFFARMTYVERYLIGCYSEADGGHFRPHVDNGGGLTAHRRFAVSVSLNDDFEGGEVVFPEYNLDGYKAPRGWSIVFPCAILHGVRRVTRGARYAYLPFLYDEAGRQIRAREMARAGHEPGVAPPQSAGASQNG